MAGGWDLAPFDRQTVRTVYVRRLYGLCTQINAAFADKQWDCALLLIPASPGINPP